MTIQTNTPFQSAHFVDHVLDHIRRTFKCRLCAKESTADGSFDIFLVMDEKNLPADWVNTLRVLLQSYRFEITYTTHLPSEIHDTTERN